MSSNLRLAAGGAVVALVALGLLGLPQILPPALADEQPGKILLGTMDGLLGKPIDVAGLIKYDIIMEPSVVTDVVRTRTVRKIGFGRTEFVEIVTTPSGVYSSDALASPHIQYPGVHKQRQGAPRGRLALWADGQGWAAHQAIDAGSFVSLIPFEGGQLLLGEDGNCLFVGKSAYC